MTAPTVTGFYAEDRFGAAADPEASLPEPEHGRQLTPPILTAEQSFAAGWSDWPRKVDMVRKRAERAGWEVRIGLSQGYKFGAGVHSSDVRVDEIGAWMRKAGQPRMVFFWTMLVDGKNPDFDPKLAHVYGADGTRVAMGHTQAKALLV